MTRAQLEHAIRAACNVADDTEIWVFGSQSILGSFPTPPVSLTASIEVDVQPRNNTKLIDFVEGSLGELSIFHRTHGFYVHCMPIENATLPLGWEHRVTAVVDHTGGQESVGWCLEPHDLAVSKLAANREKDRSFVRTLLVERMIEPHLLNNRLNGSAVPHEDRARIKAWVEATIQDL